MKESTYEERQGIDRDKFLYRCEAQVTNRFLNYETYKIIFEKIFIIKETPKGYWVEDKHYWKKWFGKESRNGYAYPTKKEALFNFKKRKEKQIKILSSRLDATKSMLFEAERIKDEDL